MKLNSQQSEQCDKAVDRVLNNELQSLPTKLAVANERLFDQYDRLSAEAALRLNSALPLMALFGLLAWKLSIWFAIGGVAAILLMRQGMARLRSANDLLVQAVVTKVIESTEINRTVRYVLETRDKNPADSAGTSQ